MAEITISKEEWPAKVRCSKDGEVFDEHLSVVEMVSWMQKGYEVAIYVNGWKEPWKLFVSGVLDVRAICPTSEKVIPKVVEEDF